MINLKLSTRGLVIFLRIINYVYRYFFFYFKVVLKYMKFKRVKTNEKKLKLIYSINNNYNDNIIIIYYTYIMVGGYKIEG